ncbi:hypothetical protein WS83_22900 [Burkholderia sp. MSMB2042]|nr:hypothetical protein WS78_20355 [Burkholderia savannae]KVG86167.1 hypothetical protein WS81_29660 [Burkholderia sp. MSMB2040]KVH00104.1 hypothetical protein WS83_22900 [Burkholderia sp. MSMB2042]KVK82265.1 hypothetical protein WS91_09880 [Burkholderia sp. MSMB1498]
MPASPHGEPESPDIAAASAVRHRGPPRRRRGDERPAGMIDAPRADAAGAPRPEPPLPIPRRQSRMAPRARQAPRRRSLRTAAPDAAARRPATHRQPSHRPAITPWRRS